MFALVSLRDGVDHQSVFEADEEHWRQKLLPVAELLGRPPAPPTRPKIKVNSKPKAQRSEASNAPAPAMGPEDKEMPS